MGTFDEINLERTEGWNAPPPRPGYRRVIVTAAIALVLLVAGFTWWMRTRPAPSPRSSAWLRLRLRPALLPSPRRQSRRHCRHSMRWTRCSDS